jgi:hypothetical protein
LIVVSLKFAFDIAVSQFGASGFFSFLDISFPRADVERIALLWVRHCERSEAIYLYPGKVKKFIGGPEGGLSP